VAVTSSPYKAFIPVGGRERYEVATYDVRKNLICLGGRLHNERREKARSIELSSSLMLL